MTQYTPWPTQNIAFATDNVRVANCYSGDKLFVVDSTDASKWRWLTPDETKVYKAMGGKPKKTGDEVAAMDISGSTNYQHTPSTAPEPMDMTPLIVAGLIAVEAFGGTDVPETVPSVSADVSSQSPTFDTMSAPSGE